MIIIDEKRIFDEIEKRRPVSVALNGPDGLLPKIQETASKIMEKFDVPAYVHANVFLGQSSFHAAGIALSTGKPTFILDPYFEEIREVTEFSEKLQKKAILSIYKAMEAETFGIVIGLKEGQFSKVTALKFKKELEKAGKKVQLFDLT